MAHLGTIKGDATLIADGGELGIVGYAISVFQTRGVKDGRGRITGAPDVLVHASAGQSTTLRLKSGDVVDIIITRFRPSNNWAEIVVSGPVPGF